VLGFLEKNKVSSKDFLVTFDITNRREHRQWKKENFSRLADLLAEKYNAKVVFLWGPGELDYVKGAMQICRTKHILCDDFDILDLAALIKKCKLHIGTSSAPGHIAVSQNTPSFIIYSKNSFSGWQPPGEMHGHIEGNLKDLSVEQVFENINNFLSKRR